MAIRFLHTNDTHGTLTAEKGERLARWREEADVYLDTGDCIKTGNLGIPLRPEPVWSVLRSLKCTAGVLGNRETHVLEAAFQAKISGASHPLLVANLRKKDGSRPLPGHLKLEFGGIRVGLLGVMVPMVTEKMKSQVASAYLWDPPIETACQVAEELRPWVDCIVALTHIGYNRDRQLAERCPMIDLIFGGHSHTVLETPVQVNKTFICQGGSHCRYIGFYEWTGPGSFAGGLRPFP